MSPVNQMVKNKQNQLTVKLYQFQGKLVIFSSSCRRHTKVGGWVHIHTEKKQYRRQKCYACAFWDNCMLVVQHQKQQLSTQTPATVLSRKPYNDTHLRKNNYYFWYGNRMVASHPVFIVPYDAKMGCFFTLKAGSFIQTCPEATKMIQGMEHLSYEDR